MNGETTKVRNLERSRLSLAALAVVGGVVGATTFTLGEAPARAQAPTAGSTAPPGSYHQTCTDIIWYADIKAIRAKCVTDSGAYVQNLPWYVGNCVGDIFNTHGQLGCSTGPTPPEGPHKAWCGERWVNGARLHAVCRMVYGPLVHSELEYGKCKGPITYVQGMLLCDQGLVPPEGSYKQSCSVRAFVDDRLELTCRKKDGTNTARASTASRRAWGTSPTKTECRPAAGASRRRGAIARAAT